MIIFIIVGSSFVNSAQTRTITGTVREYETHNFMIGVSVVFKNNQSNGTITDVNGYFEIKTTSKADSILVFSYIGYDTRETDVSHASSHVVYMRESANNFNITNYYPDSFSFRILDNCVTPCKRE